MKQRSTLVLTGAFFLVFVLGRIAHAADAPVRHSLESDYGFMIGRWTCHVTQAGTPDQNVSVEYAWSYDGHVLRETMRLGSKLMGEFFTTYDKATDTFKGVAVGAWGSYIVWENHGFQNGRLSETGFMFGGGQMTQVSRSEFERISDSHYVVRDFEVSGQPTDTEDCVKLK
jgi:hypothetical protein